MSDKEVLNHIDASIRELRSDLKESNELQHEHSKILTRLTITVEEHHKRSSLLEEQFAPVRAKFIEDQAVAKYKQAQSKAWVRRLKTAALMVGMLGSSAAAYFWSWIKAHF